MSLLDLSEILTGVAGVLGVISIVVVIRERAARSHANPPAQKPRNEGPTA